MLVFTSADENAEQFHSALHSASSFFQGVRTLLDETQAYLGGAARR